jgi:hypothetical protein
VIGPSHRAEQITITSSERPIMARTKLLIALSCLIAAPTIGMAQNLCPATSTPSTKLICIVPQVFGTNGFVLPGGSGPPQLVGSFDGNSLTPLNSAIAVQSVLLPLASPSSGITYSWDPAAKTFSPSTDSFGPIYGERADTIGKYHLFLGVGYQYLAFSSMDGNNLKSLPEVFTQPDTPLDPTTTPITTCSVSGNNTGACAFIRDVVTVANRVDYKVQEVTTFMTFGLTNRIDISVAIPIEDVKMSITSNATIVDNSGSGFHAFNTRPGCGSPTTNCLNQLFSNSGGATGIGDITVRLKGTVWKGERSGLALGADISIPTGDSLNFLGSGAAGVKPFIVWSYRARVSPHLGAGFEANGSSRIAGDITVGSKERLPSQLVYSAGADVWLTKRITAAFDLIGQSVFQTQRLLKTQYTELGACLQAYPSCSGPPFATPNVDPNINQSTGNINVLNASAGLKVKLASNLLFTGNAVFKTNGAGLRARVIPMGEISYTF